MPRHRGGCGRPDHRALRNARSCHRAFTKRARDRHFVFLTSHRAGPRRGWTPARSRRAHGLLAGTATSPLPARGRCARGLVRRGGSSRDPGRAGPARRAEFSPTLRFHLGRGTTGARPARDPDGSSPRVATRLRNRDRGRCHRRFVSTAPLVRNRAARDTTRPDSSSVRLLCGCATRAGCGRAQPRELETGQQHCCEGHATFAS